MKKIKSKKAIKSLELKITGNQTIPPTEGLPVNPNIPTHHADIVNMLISNEGLALIRFFSRAPGLNVEECRVSFTHVLAKKIVDLICKNLNYYPEHPTHQTENQKEGANTKKVFGDHNEH